MNSETKVFGGIILVTLVLVGAAMFFLSKPPVPPTRADETLLVREDSPRISTDSARITFVEFGDYQCPACAAYEPIIKRLMDTYGEDLAFVFREFPLTGHQYADITARAAVAAGLQGKYWEMHDLLYGNQDEWSESADAKPIILGYAEKIGLDMEDFALDLDSDGVKAVVDRDRQDGLALGVNATPTFYLDGFKLENPAGYEEFDALVSQVLSDAPQESASPSAQ